MADLLRPRPRTRRRTALPIVLRFISGIGDTFRAHRGSASRASTCDQRDVVVATKKFRRPPLASPFAQQAVVDEDASELFADRLMDEERGDRDLTPPESPHTTWRRPPSRGCVATSASRNCAIVQSPAQPAMRAHEIREQRRALRRVHHLGMELHAVECGASRRRSRRTALRRDADGAEARRQRVTRSPWLIHTCARSPSLNTPSNSGVSSITEARRGRTRVMPALDLCRRAPQPWPARRSRCRARERPR